MRTLEVPPPRRKFTIRSSTCACRIEGALKYSPAAAVPVRTKMPDPMIAPMPRAVSDQGPKVFLSLCPGSLASAISLSMDLQQKSCLSEVRTEPVLLLAVCAKGPSLRGTECVEAGLRPAMTGSETRSHTLCAANYRFAWPRASFFTLRFCDPRAYSRGLSGFSAFFFFRAARLDFLRSSLLSFFVFAMSAFRNFVIW